MKRFFGFEDICYDIVLFLVEDYQTLYQCSLVSKSFNAAASKELYHRIIINPPWQPLILGLGRRAPAIVSNPCTRW